MEKTITLIVTRGPLAGNRWAFDKPTTCVVGRARDCTISLPFEAEHLDVSRHHCQLDISPPAVRIRDLGSLNGTYVNRERIEETALNDGDEVQVGKFRLTFLGARRSQADRGGGAQVGA